MDERHTELPWREDIGPISEDGKSYLRSVIGPDGNTVRVTRANAALIVHSVNTLPLLVEALEASMARVSMCAEQVEATIRVLREYSVSPETPNVVRLSNIEQAEVMLELLNESLRKSRAALASQVGK